MARTCEPTQMTHVGLGLVPPSVKLLDDFQSHLLQKKLSNLIVCKTFWDQNRIRNVQLQKSGCVTNSMSQMFMNTNSEVEQQTSILHLLVDYVGLTRTNSISI